jgi:methyl-accepting chemotaxis protein
MTIDERLERLTVTVEAIAVGTKENTAAIQRLTERHEALAESVEALAIHSRENTDAIGALTSRMDTLTLRMDTLTDNVNKLVVVSNRDATDIQALANIAAGHQRRIENLENRQ